LHAVVKLFLNIGVQKSRSKTKDSRNAERKEMVREVKKKRKTTKE
jgi:hypothetical protein